MKDYNVERKKNGSLFVDLAIELSLPTRICMVCDCFENPKAKFGFDEKTWLCEKCKKALREVVERNENGT